MLVNDAGEMKCIWVPTRPAGWGPENMCFLTWASSSISSCEFSETDKCIGQSTNFFRTERPKLKSSERWLTIFSGSGLSGSVSKTEMNIFEGEESTAGILL